MKTKVVWGKNRFWVGFAAGLVAGAIATGVMLLLAASFGGISLPEAVGAALTLLMPPSWFDCLHRVIGAEAKHYLFYGILVGQCLIFALTGTRLSCSFAGTGHLRHEALVLRPGSSWPQKDDPHPRNDPALNAHQYWHKLLRILFVRNCDGFVM